MLWSLLFLMQTQTPTEARKRQSEEMATSRSDLIERPCASASARVRFTLPCRETSENCSEIVRA